jgi:hypothetical protein
VKQEYITEIRTNIFHIYFFPQLGSIIRFSVIKVYLKAEWSLKLAFRVVDLNYDGLNFNYDGLNSGL